MKMSVIPVVITVIGAITSKGERRNRPSGRILYAVYTHFTYVHILHHVINKKTTELFKSSPSGT